ncbi:enterobactin transporter EntS [Rhodococcus pyridinivorans]|uniref:Major facilitator transporter n=3 Tax=Rhodococcus TaxID=1827 RepID=V9XGX8_9NOCA|nr:MULTISPECIES: enterobactin transporter EntS [Rhodococcus]AHD22711.1 major facilitator transporter [Rhodococcus pyridinivorans SB3094]MBX4169622.1 enterobactin transporter EntS [Rhodococcus sp. DMU2021]MCD2115825.1 enterobactin transporter EntS [Rhodococcus pyridinivorans]MCD2141860.1 enterobactin transporter EntS [Rhodococcus pyridinivorans]MCD5420193.1 enterobactin transporter EntS [Rhodococcus pyridinivorans]
MAVFEKLLIDLDPLRTSREFRYLFTARVVSLFGLGFLIVAVPVQVYQLTGSTAQVAAVSAVIGVTTFGATFAGGVLADRYDRRNVIALARGTAGVAFALLAINAFLPEPQMWAIYVLAVVDGIAGGISSTALMAVTPSLIPRDKLAAAGALMALTADLGSMIGPALGGVVIAAGGVGVAYALAAFTTAITTFCITRLPSLPPTHVAEESPLKSVVSGFRYAAHNRVVGQVLIVGFLAMLLSGWAVLIPEFADEVLGVGPSVVGLLYTAPAVGAVVGSLTSGWTGSIRRYGLVVYLLMAVSAAGLVGAGATGVLAVVLLGLAAHGFGDSLADVVRYATVQRNTSDEYRGRIAAVWGAQVTAGTSVGAVAAGVVASLVPISMALTIYGVAGVVIIAIMFVATPTLRRFEDTGDLEAVG